MLSHEEGMIRINSFELEVKVFPLMDGRFYVGGRNCLIVFELANVLKKTLVADFTNWHFDTSKVEDYFGQKTFADDTEYFRLRGSVGDDAFKKSKSIQTDVFLIIYKCSTSSIRRDSSKL